MFEADSSSSGVSSTSFAQQPDKLKTTSTSQSEVKILNDDNSGVNGKAEVPEEPRPEQSNKLSSTGTEDVGKKANQAKKLCGVCGDIAKSFHFGGLSCDSCKAFFRRSVHNDSYAAFRCPYNAHCNVDKSSRKGCQSCRFQKCLSIGMETKWVMGEDERNQLKQKKEKKPEVPAEKEFEPDIGEMLKYMTAEEKDEIECIVNKYQHSYREIPFKVSHCQGSRNTIEIIQMFTTILRRFAYFTKLLPEFTALSIPDQSTLLRASVLEMCLLRGALSFDLKNNKWPAVDKLTFLKDCPQLRVEDMEKLVSKDLYDMHMQFITGIQELGADEPTVMILLLVVLFYPERGTLENQHYINQVQEKYLLLLRKYVDWRYGPKGTKTFPKLLTKLTDLRQLNDSHTEYNLNMTKTEVERIQEQLGNLNLNPYPQWVLVEDQLDAQRQQQQQQDLQQLQAEYAQQGAQAYQAQQMQNQVGGAYGVPTQSMQTQQAPPQARDFFMQFVNRKIPALVNNPFTQFPIENELAYARSFFQQQQAGGPLMMTSPERGMDMNTPPQMGGGEGMSQFKNILESMSTDQNALRQLKESLSPTVLAKLQSVFGGGGTEMPLDMNGLPPEIMSFIAQNPNVMQQQHQHQFAHPGMMPGPRGLGGFQEPHHPMAQFSQSQLTDHFANLQQQFRNPNYYYENQDLAYFQPTNDYGQQQYNYPQQPAYPNNW